MAPCHGPVGTFSAQYPEVSLLVEEAVKQSLKCELKGVRLAAAPVSFISRIRYQRRDALDHDNIPSYDRIGSQNSGIPERKLPSDCKWVPHVHPEGSVYFRQEGWVTNLWLYDGQNLRDIDATLELVSQEFCRIGLSTRGYEICLDIDVGEDEKTKDKVKLGCYYVWDKDEEEVFWLQDTPSSFFYDDGNVKILGREHLSWRDRLLVIDFSLRRTYICLKFDCRDHTYMFPHDRTLTLSQLHDLRSIMAYYLFDKKTARFSTAPYGKDDLREFLDILKEIEAVMRDDSEQKTRPEHMVIISRLRKTLCRGRVAHFHGERYYQLYSDQRVDEHGQRKQRSLPFAILTWIFFFTPQIYLSQLSAVLVDGEVNHYNLRSLIARLQDDWMASITPSAVILSAGVGFLAIQSVDGQGDGTARRSVGQIAAYMSIILSIGSILAGTMLGRQHRAGGHYSEDAAQYLLPRPCSDGRRTLPPTDQALCIEKLAILFSIPTTLFLWGLLTFFIAISWLCFHGSDTGSRTIIAVTIAISVIALLAIVPNVYRQELKHITNLLAGSLEWMRELAKEARKPRFVRFVRRWLRPS